MAQHSDSHADEHDLRHLADLLFVLTDEKRWSDLQALFVDGEIEVDMSSLVGGGPVRMTAAQLLSGFSAGLHEEKASHHMATNYRIRVDGDRAEIMAQGYSWNRLANAGGSDLWETWGTYRLTARRVQGGWKLDGLRYFAKHNRGNEAVRTHTR